ncbi:MAG: hypothetical protein EOO63_12470 [Hymenobacter sp.]|nr:MAG: hypothetical protein EOO63_12470 [Hymenobacter sp.]
MNASELLAEITRAFRDELHPGELNIVYDNFSPNPEVIQIRESFKAHSWQTIPDDILQFEQSGYMFLSSQGLHYYLPAYLHYCVREYTEADSISDGLVFSMTLPTEVDIVQSVIHLKTSPFRAHSSPEALKKEYDFYQKRLHNLNDTVHRFINRWHVFSPVQCRVILHFLEFLRDEHGQDYPVDEPAVAIERYWFQFA